MRWLLTTVLLLLSANAVFAQTPTTAPAETVAALSSSTAEALPDAPDRGPVQQKNVVSVAEASFLANGDGVKSCDLQRSMMYISLTPNPRDGIRKPCSELLYPYQQFLSTDIIIPMTWQQKGYLSFHELTDLANFATIVGISAITIGADSHSAYGPGLKGFGKIVGVSLLQDATAQFFGTFAIPSIVHQDPRYFRMPHASISKRIVYSISRTFISRHDEGGSMPNYATLLTYPIDAEISNLYVPGIHGNASSTAVRIVTGLATDPANNLLSEFLPDVAKRVHVRIIFVQRILNNVASGSNGVNLQ
jgi:hypothetical protein